ncbi:hypothetical protein AVDCRST_MAG82-1457, partial [uncultured Rubrobacteraceae bacterium]
GSGKRRQAVRGVPDLRPALREGRQGRRPLRGRERRTRVHRRQDQPLRRPVHP